MAHVTMAYHDDWLVNVLLEDNRVYTFMTELWPEHGEGSNWPSVVKRAKQEALELASRNVTTWRLPIQPIHAFDFRESLNAVCEETSDSNFWAFIQR